jgi:hypothetical protein
MLKDRLMAAGLFGQRVFEVWINEDAPPAAGDAGWDECMKQVDAADVLLVPEQLLTEMPVGQPVPCRVSSP